jgi:predicted nuclease with TOPRIM domain
MAFLEAAMSDEEVHRDLGRLEGEVAALKEMLAELRTDVKDIKTSFSEMKGGTKTLVGFAAIIGAALNQGVHWLMAK